MALNGSLMGVDIAVNMQRDIDRMMRPALQIQKMFETTRAIEDAICPPALRAMMDMHRSIEWMADPLGLRKLGAFQQSAGVCRSIADQFAFTNAMKTVMAAVKLDDNLLGASRVADLTRGLKDILGTQSALASMSPFAKLDRALDGLLPRGHHERWQDHLAKSAVPSLALLTGDWDRPIGVLASMVDPGLGASLSWLREAEVATPSVAALISEPAPLPELTIDVTITCAFCGDAMIACKQSFRWKGNRKGALEVAIIPICPTCTRRSIEDPEYAAKALRRLNGPNLRIVKGGGTSDGVRRGKLRLVKEEGGDDEPDRGE